MADPVKDHLLTLKVMRLTKPNFLPALGLMMEDEDLGGEQFNEGLRNVGGSGFDAITHCLMLPQSIENIHLGETFTCYVCVHNDSAETVTDACLKVDLQTSSQRISVPCKYQEPKYTLNPEETLGEVISHEVKEIGQHILVCAVSYTNASGEKLYFRKFFKFPVTKPLDVRTKFYNAEDNLSDDVYLEAQIQNTTHLPMVMEKVCLEPSELYTAFEVNTVDSLTNETSFDALPYLNPNDTRQYLYCLRPKPGLPAKSYRGVTHIGKLDMVWRTTMGERGRLQTSQLQRMTPGYGDLRLTVEEVPSVVKVQKAFQIVCRVHNCSERTLDLQLTVESALQQGLLWCSTSCLEIGQLEANATLDLPLMLLPVATGLQTLSGIRLTDVLLKRTYEHDEIAQVFVVT